MKRSVWLALVAILLVPQVLAIGVARPHYSDNTVAVSVDQEVRLPFQVQNGESTTKTVLFGVNVESPAQVRFENQSSFSSSVEKQFVLNSKARSDVSVVFRADDAGVYKLTYYYSQAATGGGTVTFDTKVSDSFYVKVGSGGGGNPLGIPLNYSTYVLITSATDPRFVNDLVVKSIYSNWPQIDFSGVDVDLSGFTEPVIRIESKRRVTVNSSLFPKLNESAKITFYDVGSNFKILKDGVDCPSSLCSVYSKTSSKLVLLVKGFSTYEVQEFNVTTPVTNPPPGPGGSTGGSIPPRSNGSRVNNSVRPPVVSPPVQDSGGVDQGSGNQNSGSSSTGGQTGSTPSEQLIDSLDKKQQEIVNNRTLAGGKKISLDGKNKALLFGLAAGGLIALVISTLMSRKSGEGDSYEE